MAIEHVDVRFFFFLPATPCCVSMGAGVLGAGVAASVGAGVGATDGGGGAAARAAFSCASFSECRAVVAIALNSNPKLLVFVTSFDPGTFSFSGWLSAGVASGGGTDSSVRSAARRFFASSEASVMGQAKPVRGV